VLRFEVPRTGRSRVVREQRYLITEKDGRLLRAFSAGLGRKIEHHRQGRLILGADPFAVELEALGISSVPLICRFLPSIDQAVGLPRESDPLGQ